MSKRRKQGISLMIKLLYLRFVVLIMSQRNCLVLLQLKENSKYNDFEGKYYHFPKKYLKQLEKPNTEFVYFDPKKNGNGVYFGSGRIGKIFEDKREGGKYFAEILDYKPFSKPVPFYNKTEGQREGGEKFNFQNGVRPIPSDVFDEICLDGGIILNFKADAHLIRVLGEQLIANERIGILELVKNSYDAGASYCNVRIEKVPSLIELSSKEYKFNQFDGPVIVIEDDGSGMNRQDIELGWLRPASIVKTDIKQRIKIERLKAINSGKLSTYNRFVNALEKEYNGRIPLGEKGVGRFATHRLGRKVIIKTKVREHDYEYILEIDWDKFDMISDKPVDLDTIGVSLSRQPISRDYGAKNSGTQITIYGGRDDFELEEEEIREINRTLIKLNTPNPGPNTKVPTFKVSFECPQVPDLAEKPYRDYFEPIFTITGIVDELGKFNYDFFFNPPTSADPPIPMPKESRINKIQDLRLLGSNKEYWEDGDNKKLIRKPICGEFYIHLEVWYRSSPWIAGPFSGEFKQELEDYGGIAVYRDGINVFPAEWGAETDWLDLSKRHIKKGMNISYYNMMGNVEITQSLNVNLIDKTNREGVLKNRAYNDLRKLVRGVVLLLETDVKGKRDDYSKLTGDVERDPSKLKEAPRLASDIMKRIDENYDVPKDPLGILHRLGEKNERKVNLVNLQRSLKNLEKSLDIIKENQDLMTEQAGFGLSIAVVIHEIAKTTSNFYHGITEVLKSKQPNQKKLELLQDASLSLQSEIKRISPLRAIKNEPQVEFKISKSIKFCREVFRPPMEKANINIEFDVEKDFPLVARYGAVNQVITNLIDNSVYWLSRMDGGERKIFVKVNSANRTIIFADNGPGIHESILPYLFQPGYSLKFPPSGLGLYICKYYMLDIKGEIYLTNENERIKGFNGAQFTLDFSRVKKETDGK